MKYKYVKFSRSATKNNPKMIINEYDRLINDFTEKIKSLSSLKNTIPIQLEAEDINTIKNLPYSHLFSKTFDIFFNYEELKDIIDIIELKFAKEISLKQELSLIISEKDYFITKFNNKN